MQRQQINKLKGLLESLENHMINHWKLSQIQKSKLTGGLIDIFTPLFFEQLRLLALSLDFSSIQILPYQPVEFIFILTLSLVIFTSLTKAEKQVLKSIYQQNACNLYFIQMTDELKIPLKQVYEHDANNSELQQNKVFHDAINVFSPLQQNLNINSPQCLRMAQQHQHMTMSFLSDKQKKRSSSFSRTPQVRRVTGQFYVVQKEFDPFKSPPDFQLVETHRKASLVGKATEQQKMDQTNYCPCCYSIVEKNQIPISCNEQELAFLGVGYSQVFLLNKYFGLMLLIIFIVGGSLLLLINNQINCIDNCLKIAGIAVMADKDIDIELMNPYLQTIAAMAIIGTILYAKKKINKKLNKFKEGYLTPSEYTIMVQNLPLDIKKEELKKYFEKLTNRAIVRISMAYDTEKYNFCIEQKGNDIKQYNLTNLQIKRQQEQLAELTSPSQNDSKQEKKINKIKNKIVDLQNQNRGLEQEMVINDEFIKRFEEDCLAERDPSKFIGTAFLTFRDTVPVNTIIEEWGYTYTNICKFIIFKWAQSPFIEYKEQILIIRKAPAPADIIWENLRYSLPRNVVNNTLMLLLSCLILYISFRIQFLVMEYVYPLKKESYEEHSFILMIRGSLLSICIVIVNLSLRNTVFFFTKSQKFDHHTKLLNAYINKYIFLYFFNSAFMPYLVHCQLDDSDTELLIWDIHFIIIATSLSTPFSKLFDPVMFFKMFKRWQIKSYKPEECPYTQKEANHWFEGHPIEIADSYAFMARVLFLGTWYVQVAPFAVLFSLLGLVCNHYIDKHGLLRVHSTPEQITEEVYSKVLTSLDLLPFIYLCGGIEYDTKKIISTNVFAIIFKFRSQSLALVGLFLSLLAYIFHQKRLQSLKAAKKENRKYEEVRTLFNTEYDRCNPVTQLKASNDYIKFLYEQKALIIQTEQEMESITKGKSSEKAGLRASQQDKNEKQKQKISSLSSSQRFKSKQEPRQLNGISQMSSSSEESEDEDNHNHCRQSKEKQIIKNANPLNDSLLMSNVSVQGTIGDNNFQDDTNSLYKFEGANRLTTSQQLSNQAIDQSANSFPFKQCQSLKQCDLESLPSIKYVQSEDTDNELIRRILERQNQIQAEKEQLNHSNSNIHD